MFVLEDRPLRILHVDADASYARLVRQSLTKGTLAPCELVLAGRLDTAVERLAKEHFDAALVDLWLPDSEGLETCIRLGQLAAGVPIVVLTGADDDALALAALEADAQDFLVKGNTDGNAVMRALRFAIERVRRRGEPVAATNLHDGSLPRILLVERNPADLAFLEESLTNLYGAAYESVRVGRLGDALERLGVEPFSLVVLDLSLPDSRGVATCDSVRCRAPGVPFVVYTDSDDDALALKTVQQGASDYLVKGRASSKAMARSIQFAMQRCRRSWQRAIDAASCVPGRVLCDGESDRTTSNPPDGASAFSSVSHFKPEPAPPKDRRRPTRYPLIKSVLAIPIALDGRPDSHKRLPGITFDLSVTGIGLELDADRLLDAPSLILGVEGRDGELCYVGVDVRHQLQVSARRLRVGGRLGGRGEGILSPATLMPRVDLSSMRIVCGMPDEVLASWSEIGVLRPVLLDRVHVCPKCRGMPTFRSGCRSCGSARISAARLIHHFACAHVGPAVEFEAPGGLACPKCRTRPLVIGADFEYQAGPYRCQDCHWNGSELEQVAQCLRCGFRFPGHQAQVLEMIGYHVHRLDPLAFISAP